MEERSFISAKPRKRVRWLSGQPGPAATTYRRGNGLFGHNLQGVDHWDVAKPPGDGQGRVPILWRGRRGPGVSRLAAWLGACALPHAWPVRNLGRASHRPQPTVTHVTPFHQTSLARNPSNLFYCDRGLGYYTQNPSSFFMLYVTKGTTHWFVCPPR